MKKVLVSSSIILSLFLVGCGEDEKKVEVQKVEPKVQVKEEKSTVDMVKEASSKVSDTVSKAASEVSTTVVETTKEVVQKAKPMVEEKVEEVKKAVTQALPTIEKKEINAKALYAACASCHGQSAERPALGKSKIIKGWSSDKIVEALNGYKDGSYGGAMKGIMKGQVATKTPEEIKALANYIASF